VKVVKNFIKNQLILDNPVKLSQKPKSLAYVESLNKSKRHNTAQFFYKPETTKPGISYFSRPKKSQDIYENSPFNKI
jgi:hypothetical protein